MSWRQYGGTNKTLISTVNVGSVVANQFLSRSTAANVNSFDDLKVRGQLISQDFIQSGTFIKANGQLVTGGNLVVNKQLFFGADTSFVSLPWTYVYGNSYGISINNKNPQSIFHITGLTSDVLKIDTSMNTIRNIIGQNVNARGIVISSDDTSSNILFFNNISTDKKNSPESFIKNKANIGLSLGSYNSSISLDSSGNILLDASGAINLSSKSGVFKINSNNTTINSYLNISKRSNGNNYNGNYNESAVIYDNSNSVYLLNVYDVSSALTGNALSLISYDNSSNAFMRIIDPSGAGFSIGGGAFPPDITRSFGIISLSDMSGNYIQSQNIVSGKDPFKYSSTIGINTFSPKTERYVLDINGPTRIGNGELKTVFNASFEFKNISFSKISTNFAMAVGSSSSTGILSGSNIIYPQYFSYTVNNGLTWNTLPINIPSGNLLQSSNNSINSIYVYDQNFAILGTINNTLFWTNNGGLSWNILIYNSNDPNLLYRNTTSIYVQYYNSSYRVFLSFEYSYLNTTPQILKYNTIYFTCNPYSASDPILTLPTGINYVTSNTINSIQNYYTANINNNVLTYSNPGPTNYNYKINSTDCSGQYIYFAGDGIIKIDGTLSAPTTIYNRQNLWNYPYNSIYV